MATARICLVCGAELASDTPEGLCPKCLLERGLPRDPSTTSTSLLEKTVLDKSSSRAAMPCLPRAGERFGSYLIVRLLGRGGMGAVYEAEHLPSDRRVALKILSQAMESPEARERFLREGRLAALVNHPNSVYVYGTEEIDGMPAITMELASGGTLTDRVQKDGPLPVSESVDTILQLIAGLNAAYAKGVLHRDIKPSNCFMDMDGKIKIGDYGLSLSLAQRVEKHLTVSGTFLGTPAFSSPEQLRGEEVDVRSDIYSVGVTLYFLLTGRTPFQGENFVQLLATVLEEPAASPKSLRSELPKELANVVLRCLEKMREKRFRDYDELCQALLPYSSTTPTPAPLLLRAFAYVIDGVLLIFLLVGLITPLIGLAALLPSLLGQVSATQLAEYGLLLAFCAVFLNVTYFGVTEGIWGASLGKKLCRLRVVDSNRDVPGLMKATLRALVFVWVQRFGTLIALAYNPAAVALESLSGLTGMAKLTDCALFALLFSTVRRTNGFAAVHDLLTNTRVIRKPIVQARPVLDRVEESLPSTAGWKLGPFLVHSTLAKTDSEEELLLASDPVLLRRVWIHMLPPDTPPVLPNLRTLGRIGRFRWLNGKRTPTECWDAYEAASGAPFLTLVGKRQSWKTVRYWLLDLAEELCAALKDHTPPAVISLDRIWITSDGRAKLLDFPAPDGSIARSQANSIEEAPSGDDDSGHNPQGKTFSVADVVSIRQFLHLVAATALEGRVPGYNESNDQRAEATLTQATKICAYCGRENDAAMVACTECGTDQFEELRTLRTYFPPTLLLPLHASEFLNELKQASSLDAVIDHLTLILHRETEISRSSGFRAVFVCALPQLPLALYVLFALFAPLIRPRGGLADEWLFGGALIGSILALTCVVIPSLICALLFRGGYLLHRLGISVVTEAGTRASGPQVFWRSLVTWLPAMLLIGAFLKGAPLKQRDVPHLLLMLAIQIFYLGAGIWTVLTPRRSLQDRIAGTWLVPK